jgi:MoxR-like ATPase
MSFHNKLNSIVVKTGKRTWAFYNLQRLASPAVLSIASKHSVTKKGRAASCTCSNYVTSGECIHVDVIQSNYAKASDENQHTHCVVLSGGKETVTTWVKPPKVEVGDMWVQFRGKQSLISIAPPSIDVSAYDFFTNFDYSQGTSTTESFGRLAHDLEFMFLKTRETSLLYKAPEIVFQHRDLCQPSAIESFAASVKKGPWDGVPKPKGFAVSDKDWKILLYCLCKSKPIMLIGGTGCGKTELVAHAVDALDRDLESFNCGAMQNPRTSLIGRTHLGKDGTFFKKARFVEAVTEKNMVILADEISRSGPDVFNILLPVLDRQGYISIDEDEETEQVFVHPTVSIVATANVGSEYTGTMSMDRALTDRFLKINLDYPEVENEVDVLTQRHSNVPRDWVEKLSKTAWQQRQLTRESQEFSIEISTRMLFDTVEMVEDGIPTEEAIDASILASFSDEGGGESERENVRMLFKKEKMVK